MNIPYNKLTENDKSRIMNIYYDNYVRKETSFKMLASMSGVSERAFARVLKEAGVNTRRRRPYTLDENYFNNIDTEAKAYLLGIMLADGCATSYNYIALQMKDREIVELLKNEINYSGEITEKLGKDAGGFSSEDSVQYRVNFSSENMAKYLIGYGKITNYNIKSFPKIKKYLLRHFLRGYFDADGSVTIYSKTKIVFSIIASKEFSIELKQFFEEYFDVNVSIDQSHTEWMYYVRIHNTKICREIYKYLYNDSHYYIQRKKDKFSEIM